MCYQPEELGSIVSHTNTASAAVAALYNKKMWKLKKNNLFVFIYKSRIFPIITNDEYEYELPKKP